MLVELLTAKALHALKVTPLSKVMRSLPMQHKMNKEGSRSDNFCMWTNMFFGMVVWVPVLKGKGNSKEHNPRITLWRPGFLWPNSVQVFSKSNKPSATKAASLIKKLKNMENVSRLTRRISCFLSPVTKFPRVLYQGSHTSFVIICLLYCM